MLSVPPWIKFTPEQEKNYLKLRASMEHYQCKWSDEDIGVVCNDDVHPSLHTVGVGDPCRILSLLRTRELVGSSSSLSCRRGVPCGVSGVRGKVATPDRLAKVGAWNRRRLQNMILAVGPGTPASFLIQGDEFGVGDEEEEEDEDEVMYIGDSANEEEEQDEDDDEVDVEVDIEEEEDDGEGGEALDSTDGHDDAVEASSRAAPDLRRDVQQHHHEMTHRRREEREAQEEAHVQTRNTNHRWGSWYNPNNLMMSSMIHAGCINTASWLDSGWRISTIPDDDESHLPAYCDYDVDEELICRSDAVISSLGTHSLDHTVDSIGPTEYPTQLVTSGDDRLVRFWDVSNSMGGISPWPGGADTRTPYSSFLSSGKIVDAWRIRCWKRCIGEGIGYDSLPPPQILPGTVHPLATLNSGHRGNVFHVTTIPHSPGKVATCGADGFLRLHDVETELQQQRHKPSPTRYSTSTVQSSSSVIISPEYHSENNTGQRRQQVHVYPEGVTLVHSSSASRMCFSHHFLSPNVGLVCSEGGLLHFDARVPPSSQKRGSLVPELSDCCRACVPWRLGVGDDNNYGSNSGELESAYVFAGGNHTEVGLYDLRMTGSSSSLLSSSDVANYNNVVQKYRPAALHGKNGVAVSGIDLSKDKREILVSYESDHIYAFPVFGGKREPTLQDVEQATMSKNETVSDYSSYGGHLNRHTFLKMARYAGPNDEYICTGSDSGHAWIYEKATGSVVSLLKADTSTCNGVLPHPTLPYFITYGIDSTAKLWRATTPVDKDVDDSDLGRFNHSQRVDYVKSLVADRWNKHKKRKIKVRLAGFFPDEHASEDNDGGSGLFGGMFMHSRTRDTNPFIGNDLMNLSELLTKNYFQCARSASMGSNNDDVPVKGAILPMKIRVNLMKLHHQANRMGLAFDEKMPCVLKPKQHLLTNSINGDSERDWESIKLVSYGCVADFIPDPSDWLPFDVPFSSPPLAAGMPFNLTHKEYLYDLFANQSCTPIVLRDVYSTFDYVNGVYTGKYNFNVGEDNVETVNANPKCNIDDVPSTQQPQSNLEADNKPIFSQADQSALALDMLFQTVSILKEAGNSALKASLPYLAAKRYDKAINYCAISYLKFPVPLGMEGFISEQQDKISKNGGYECCWTELLQTLIMVRLNLAMVLLTSEIKDAKGAMTQAKQSLKELKPFATEKGVVFIGKKLANKRTDESQDTYVQAKALQAKAYFRLGSAQLILGEYDEAVKSLECSIGSTKEAHLKVDTGLMRKLNQAKRFRNDKIERQRKKFKLLFSSSIQDDNCE